MSLNSIFNAMKKEGYIIKDLDLYLLSLNGEDNDRAIDVNAPSQIGSCPRARYYARTGAPSDSTAVDARTRRIFDNGTGVHERLQRYLLEQGMLLMDEVPVVNSEYNIQGHTDGALKLSPSEIGILEIKSINSNGFSNLKAPKEHHVMQGLSYIFCVEQRRIYLHEKYKTREDFDKSLLKRKSSYARRYQHLKGGRKYSRQEKINFQVALHAKMDSILYDTDKPITKAVFLYENKDTQDLKEFTISSTDPVYAGILESVLEECAYVNKCVEEHTVPPRCGKSKSDSSCRWCNYKSQCWVV